MVNRHRRTLMRVSIGAACVVAAATAATAATIAHVARLVVTPQRTVPDDVAIHSVAPDLTTITVTSTPDTLVPGKYGFWFAGDNGHLCVGDVLATTPSRVTRRIEAVSFGDPRRARTGRISSWWYLRPEELGLPVTSVQIDTELGSAPAWLFPCSSRSTRWAIHVHGRGTRRQESLRAITTFQQRGYTSLIVSYRNDGDAPMSSDGRYGLGSTEWHDVDAAIAYAMAHGATDVVLVGWSMGGAIVLQTVTRSHRAEIIRGVVLDSPVVNWLDTLQYQASMMRLPGVVTRAALALIAAPWARRMTGLASPIDLSMMDFVTRSAALQVPVLLMHSDDDGYVPATGSRALAQARPDIVTFIPFSVARHAKLWNYDTDRWIHAVDTWLRELAPAAR
jgi:uncharacterized protein